MVQSLLSGYFVLYLSSVTSFAEPQLRSQFGLEFWTSQSLDRHCIMIHCIQSVLMFKSSKISNECSPANSCSHILRPLWLSGSRPISLSHQMLNVLIMCLGYLRTPMLPSNHKSLSFTFFVTATHRRLITCTDTVRIDAGTCQAITLITPIMKT